MHQRKQRRGCLQHLMFKTKPVWGATGWEESGRRQNGHCYEIYNETARWVERRVVGNCRNRCTIKWIHANWEGGWWIDACKPTYQICTNNPHRTPTPSVNKTSWPNIQSPYLRQVCPVCPLAPSVASPKSILDCKILVTPAPSPVIVIKESLYCKTTVTRPFTDRPLPSKASSIANWIVGVAPRIFADRNETNSRAGSMLSISTTEYKVSIRCLLQTMTGC